MEDSPTRMCAAAVEIQLKYLGLWFSHQDVMYTRTLICENYSVSRKFYSGRPNADSDIRVGGVVEQAESGQLKDQSHEEITNLVYVSGTLPELSCE